MYRVIIADDESMIRNGLRETVEWDALGLELCGEAADGREALKLAGQNKPHILITDIKMPGMNGIELIKEIKKQDSDIKVIILSAFSDYVYLKEAILSGAENYLLKPIDNEELTQTLVSTVSNIEQEIFQNITQHQGVELLRANTLNRLITQSISPREFKEKRLFLGIDLNAHSYQCAVLTTNFKEAQDSPSGDGHTGLYAIQNICSKLIKNFGLSFFAPDGRIVILFCINDNATIRSSVNDILKGVEKNVLESLAISLTAGVGICVNCVEDIWKSYSSAVKCLEYGMFVEDNGIICYDRIGSLINRDDYVIDINYEHLNNLFRLGKKEEFFSCTDEIFAKMMAAYAVPIDYVRNFVIRLAIRIIDAFMDLNINPADASAVMEIKYAELLSFRKLSDFKQWFRRICEKMFDDLKKQKKVNNHLIKNVIVYIENNYTERLTLKHVAAVFYVNTSYLGHLFKREMGESFTDYINKYRIKKAQALLSDSALKAYAIAEQVGYTDYRYFLKIFKKITGVNPTAIRQ